MVPGTKVPSHFYCQLSSGSKGVEDLVEAAFGSDAHPTSPPVYEKMARLIEAHPVNQQQNSTLDTHTKAVNVSHKSVTDNNESVNVTDNGQSVNHTADNVHLHRVHLIRKNETLEDFEEETQVFILSAHQNRSINQFVIKTGKNKTHFFSPRC